MRLHHPRPRAAFEGERRRAQGTCAAVSTAASGGPCVFRRASDRRGKRRRLRAAEEVTTSGVVFGRKGNRGFHSLEMETAVSFLRAAALRHQKGKDRKSTRLNSSH